jgi:hypothetical protein
LLKTCKINQINPEHWLTDAFNRIQDCKTADLPLLLPEEWAETKVAPANTLAQVM